MRAWYLSDHVLPKNLKLCDAVYEVKWILSSHLKRWQAVVNVIKRDHPDQEIKVANAEGLKECRQLLKLATLGKYPGYLLEGMACPGGCVAGAGTMQAIKKSQTSVGLYAKQSTHKTSSETEYIKELNKLVD